jgi:hypothetical protein
MGMPCMPQGAVPGVRRALLHWIARRCPVHDRASYSKTVALEAAAFKVLLMMAED